MNQQLCTALKGRSLAPREIEATCLAARGLRNAAIAAEMGISTQTIKGYFTVVFKKLGVKSRSELIIWCVRVTYGQLFITATNDTQHEEINEKRIEATG